MNKQVHRAKPEQGVALILVLIMVLVVTAMVAGIIFVTQTQTWTSYSYKSTAQARYAAEAGVQRTMNWLQSSSYTPPSNFAVYNMTTYPVQSTGGNPLPIVLSADTAVQSANYPDGFSGAGTTTTMETAFNSTLGDQSIPGISNATFSTYATLLRMTPGTGASFLTGTAGVPQVWLITSIGSIAAAGIRPTTVQLQAVYERTSTPIFTYGVAGDGYQCPQDVTFTNGSMNSWNSSNGGTYAGTMQNSGASIASNGNVTLTGGTTAIYGTISDSTNINVGNCPADITDNGGGSFGGASYQGLSKLNQPLVYPNPSAPNPATPTGNVTQNSNSSCDGSWAAGACTFDNTAALCPTSGAPCFKITPNNSLTPVVSYGNLTANQNIHLSAGTYNFNSLQMNGGSITLDSVPVVINLGGNSVSAGGNLFILNSSTTVNAGGVPANLQIVTAAGAGMANPPVIQLNGSSSIYAVVYAPNAYVHITGSSRFLGAVVGQTVKSDSSGGFSYDVALQNSLLQVGNFVPVSYAWNKF